MSETELLIGKLIPTAKTIEEYMEGKDCPEYYTLPDDLQDWFDDNYYEQAVVIDGEVFEVEKKDYEEQDIFTIEKTDDGSYNFTLKYYNGSCGFNEAIDHALAKL